MKGILWKIQSPPYRCVFALSLLLAIPITSTAEENGGVWKVGLAKVVITPPKPVPLGGYASRKGFFQRVEQDIHAKALALEDADGGRALLVTCELVGLNRYSIDIICRRIMETSGLPRDAIMVNFSHTHTAPAATLAMASRGHYTQEEADAIVSYTQWMADRVVEVAGKALQQQHRATLGYGSGQVKFPVNRRQKTAKGVILGFDHNGPVDRNVPVLAIVAPDERLLGVVFGAACHNTCLGAKDNFICGDYAGYAQEILGKAMGGAQVMFVQGCGGDTSPYPTGSLGAAKAHGAELAQEVERVLKKDELRPVRGPVRTHLATVALPLEPGPSLEEIGEMAKSPALWRQQRAAYLLKKQRSGGFENSHYHAPLAVWQFGSDLTLVGLPGEPVADYVRATQKVLGKDHLWMAGYCNDFFGYLPNARILKEGGYEAQRGPALRTFAPGIETVVTKKLRELAIAAGRPGIPEKNWRPGRRDRSRQKEGRSKRLRIAE